MTVEMVRGVLLWSGIINYGILILWAVIFFTARKAYHRLVRWFGLAPEHFDLIQFAGMTLFKLAIFFFNFVPYMALRIVG